MVETRSEVSSSAGEAIGVLGEIRRELIDSGIADAGLRRASPRPRTLSADARERASGGRGRTLDRHVRLEVLEKEVAEGFGLFQGGEVAGVPDHHNLGALEQLG